jgi:hypothetical protein
MHLNDNLLLSLPFREGTGSVLTHDEAKPHHLVTQIHAPVWTTLPSGLQVLDFDGAFDYLECQGADCADLDFTAGDFSLACWICPDDLSGTGIVMGRYELDVSGWEWYVGSGTHLSLRANHGGAPTRTSADGTSLVNAVWQLVGVSRSGLYPLMYQNGQAMAMTYSAGGMQNPAACGEDLVIGVRFTKNAAHFNGKMSAPRIWGRSLAASEWAEMFEQERHLFGV